MKNRDIAIIGAGGFGREVKTIIDAINSETLTYNFIGFYDDNIEKGKLINGFPILGGIHDLQNCKSNIEIILGVGDPKVKQSIISTLKNKNIFFPNLIHPSVIISDDLVKIGRGSIICAGCIITCNIEIEDFVTLNLCCTVGHDTVLNEYSSFMPAVNISGEVIIEKGVYIGTGAKIINMVEIGENTIIGAGAVVAKSLAANCTAVGIPAKVIKYQE